MSPTAAPTICAVKPTRSSNVEQMWEGLARVHSSMTAALEHDMVPEAGMPLAWYEGLLNLSRSPRGVMRYPDLARVAGLPNKWGWPRPGRNTQGPRLSTPYCS